MARYPSGITGNLPGDDVDDLRVRLAQMTLEMDAHPIDDTAPCMNPECVEPVDYLGRGDLILYCSSTCRARVSTMRRRATQQLELLNRTLDEARHRPDVPRDEMRARARKLRAWLRRLDPTASDSV